MITCTPLVDHIFAFDSPCYARIVIADVILVVLFAVFSPKIKILSNNAGFRTDECGVAFRIASIYYELAHHQLTSIATIIALLFMLLPDSETLVFLACCNARHTEAWYCSFPYIR